MKKRYLSLLILGASALTLSSCGASEISLEEFKTQLDANSKKEAPGYTKAKMSVEIKNYKFECSNKDVASIVEGTLNVSLKQALKAQGFDIDDNADLKKGYKDTTDCSAAEVKELLSIRYTGKTIGDEIDSEHAKFYKDGNKLKAVGSVKEENISTTSAVYFDEYSYICGTESDLLIEQKDGKDSIKLSLSISSFYTFSK